MVTGAIPTQYAGIQFRSRLEARWAAFFDLVGCEWEYEPVDLDGYIPDFVVHRLNGEDGKRIVVEVKPVWLSDSIEDIGRKALDRYADLLGVGDFRERFAVVGHELRQPHPCFTDGGDITLGRFAFKHGTEIATRPFDLWWCDEQWHWVSGDKDHGTTPTATDRLVGYWREAGNRVQWRAPRPSR